LQHHGNAKSGGGCAYVGGPIREVLHMRLPELESAFRFPCSCVF